MKLNKEGRNELRRRVDIKLKDVEFNPKKRIKLPKERLYEFLFEIKKDSKGVLYKEFAYDGDNLCKIDLSEVDFMNVSFNQNIPINLSNVNARIDFTETYEIQNDRPLVVNQINFDGTDLSNNNLKSLTSDDVTSTMKFNYCKLTNTSLSLDGEYLADFNYCDLSNLNLNGRELEIVGGDRRRGLVVATINDNYLVFTGCNLSGTKVRIITSGGYHSEDIKDSLKFAISNNQLDKCIFVERNCYNEDKEHIIKTKKQKATQKSALLKKYTLFESNTINETLDYIDYQLSTNGGRILNMKMQKNQPNKKEGE